MSKQKRQSQNSRIMRDILNRLQEYDLDEIDLLCQKYRSRQNRSGRRGARPPEDPGGDDSALEEDSEDLAE